MTEIEIKKLEEFFLPRTIMYKNIVWHFLTELEKRISFKLKIQKASIQCCGKVPFGVVAFRRSKSFFFVEFYSNDPIDNNRITLILSKPNKPIIYRVHIDSLKQIDEELINWMVLSKALVG